MGSRSWVARARAAGLLAGLVLTCTAGAFAQQVAGIAVDAEGVLRKQIFEDPTGALTRQRIAAAQASLEGDLARASTLRKVSLNRLEAELAERIELSRAPSNEMLHLAGLTRLQYVFYYPDTQDIVIAGPAEPWAEDLSGRARGIDTGRPVLLLEDLAVALRTHRPDATEEAVVGCSIDPTAEGLARMQDFLRRVGVRATPNDTEFIVQGLRESLGLQDVRVLGVPANTHFAQVMVEADYRMKLIGIGLERPPIKLASYVDLASPSSVARNALQRWYFVPDYECVRVSEDLLAMELIGDGVKLVGANEMVAADGQRRSTTASDRASTNFVRGFTRKYGELAEVSPVYAQLRNSIDLLVAAAYISQQDYYAMADWDAGVLIDEAAYRVETHHVAKQVATTVASVWKGNRLMTPVGGGVQIQATRALDDDMLLDDEGGAVAQIRDASARDEAIEGWWWD